MRNRDMDKKKIKYQKDKICGWYKENYKIQDWRKTNQSKESEHTDGNIDNRTRKIGCGYRAGLTQEHEINDRLEQKRDSFKQYGRKEDTRLITRSGTSVRWLFQEDLISEKRRDGSCNQARANKNFWETPESRIHQAVSGRNTKK